MSLTRRKLKVLLDTTPKLTDSGGKKFQKICDHIPKRIEVDRGGDKEDFIQNIAL